MSSDESKQMEESPGGIKPEINRWIEKAVGGMLPTCCSCCPHGEGETAAHTSEQQPLEMLSETMKDPEGSTLQRRILALGYHYLGLWNHQMDIIQVKPMCVCLEFFSRNVKELKCYRELLIGFLGKCQRPIVLQKMSELQMDKNNLPQLFSSLGRCLCLLQYDPPLQFLILETVTGLLAEKRPPEVRIEVVREALKMSSLLGDLKELAGTTDGRLYNKVLELLKKICIDCSLGGLLLSMGCLELFLSKVNVEKRMSFIDHEKKCLSSDLIWLLLDDRGTSTDLALSPTISQASAECVSKWFRRDIVHGREDEKTNIAALVLKFIMAYQRSMFLTTPLMRDILLVATAADFGTEGTWASGLSFGSPGKEMRLRKILITIITYKSDDPVVRLLLQDAGLITSLSLLLDPSLPLRISWSPENRRELIFYSLHALPFVAKGLKTEFINSGATSRILKLIKCFSENEKNLKIVRACCECLYYLSMESAICQLFTSLQVADTILDLMALLLKNDKLTLLAQNILGFCCDIIYSLATNQTFLEKYENVTDKLAVCLLRRMQQPKKNDSIIDCSLMISGGALVWRCVVKNKNTRMHFIVNEGIYTILDLIENAIFPVQVYYLGILNDCFFDSSCIPQIVTWRGCKVDTSVLGLFCKLWRRQEELKRVCRDENGCIGDIECVLMGEKQKETEIKTLNTIPALVEMVGCARPKIASMVHFITKTYSSEVELSQSIYMVPTDNISKPDQITLEIIKYYEELKEGEMFWEIQKASEASKIRFLPLDVTITHDLVMRHIGAAQCILKKQVAILNFQKNIYAQEEMSMYNDIRESEMMKTLRKAKAVKKYLKLSNFEYREQLRKEKELLLKSLDETISEEDNKYHKTFSLEWT